VVGGSLLGAAIGTVLSVLVGFGPGVALLAALTAMIMLPLLQVFHPPGVALFKLIEKNVMAGRARCLQRGA
jgi:hypothetical protein